MIQFGGLVNPVKYCCTTRKRPCATNVDSDLRSPTSATHSQIDQVNKKHPRRFCARMKIGLFGAFAFLLGCAGLYYLTQFSLVTSLSDTHRSGRSQREKSWLQEQREIMEKDGADSVAHTDLRSRQKKLRQRRKKLLAAAKRQASGRAAEQEDSTSHGHEEAAPDSSADALAQKQPIDGSNVRAAAAAAAAAAAVAAPAAGAAAGACNRTRRPYHVVMTAASGLYQEWQSRIAYYHYQKMKRLNPCSDIGGFTRLFNTPNAQPDSLMDEIPTVLVKQLGHGT